MSIPQFLLCQFTAAAGDAAMQYASRVGEILTAHSGTCIVAAPAEKAQPLEDGTTQHGLLAYRFPSAVHASAFWSSADHRTLRATFESAPGFLHIISVPGIPEEGLPGEPLPTTANVTIPEHPGPKAYMLVQGTVSDPGPIGKYMDTIVPMIIERGGVYRAWTDPEGPQVLAGDWPRQYVVFSEWPSIEAARDFWYSDTYQNVAIPLRRPASAFTVLLFEASG